MISKSIVRLKAVCAAAELTAGSVIFNWENIAARLKPDWQADIVKENHYQNMQCSCDGVWTFDRFLTHTHLQLNPAVWSIPPHCYNGGVVKKKLTEWWLSFLPLHYHSWTSGEIEVHPIRVALFLSVDVPVYFLSLSVTLYLLSSSLLSSLSLTKCLCFSFSFSLATTSAFS